VTENHSDDGYSANSPGSDRHSDNNPPASRSTSNQSSNEDADPKPTNAKIIDFASQDKSDSDNPKSYYSERDTVKENRKMVQYFLRDETQEIEDEIHERIEKEMEADISLIDVREAIVRMAADHISEIADELRDWGYESNK
jgi:predicted acylesterase/phospholipase RssA